MMMCWWRISLNLTSQRSLWCRGLILISDLSFFSLINMFLWLYFWNVLTFSPFISRTCDTLFSESLWFLFCVCGTSGGKDPDLWAPEPESWVKVHVSCWRVTLVKVKVTPTNSSWVKFYRFTPENNKNESKASCCCWAGEGLFTNTDPRIVHTVPLNCQIITVLLMLKVIQKQVIEVLLYC